MLNFHLKATVFVVLSVSTPAKLNKLALAKDYEGFAANNGLDCIECGSCSYVCPAKRHLTQTLRICKRETMAIMRAKAQKK